MSLNKIRNAFYNTIKSGSIKEQYILICIITAIIYVGLFFLNYIGVLQEKSFSGICNDTPSYVSAGERLFKGEIDILRTPVYPFICHVARMISNSQFVLIIRGFQIGAFFISIYYYLKLNHLFLQEKYLIFLSVLVYALFPYNFRMNIFLATESLSISMFVIYCYYLIDVINKVSYTRIIISFLLTIFLIFIRPSFVYILPLSLVWYSYVFYKKRTKYAFFNIVFVIVSVLCYVAYCNAYENKYKIFATSHVSYLNQYEIMRRHNLLDTSILKDKKQQIFIKKNMKDHSKLLLLDSFGVASWETTQIIDKYGLDVYVAFIKGSMKNNIKSVVNLAIKRFFLIDVINHELFSISRIIDLVGFYCIYIILLTSLLFYFVWAKCRKKVPLLSFLFFILISANIIVVTVGAQYEYMRLMLPSIPLVIVIAFQLINYACSKKRKYIFNIV